jgi:hypothetical protein
MKPPDIGTACAISRTTATGMRLAPPPMLRFVGSKVIQPVRQDMEFQIGPGLWFGSELLLWHTSGHDS